MITRRALLTLLAASAAAVPASAAGEHASIAYMKRVGKDMLNAHRQGTVAAFQRVIQRHADLPTIGDYSLGSYNKRMGAGQRGEYYRAVSRFIARYFALQSREYEVAKYEIGEASSKEAKNVTVSSRVYLLSGQSYTVKWDLVWRGGRYKVQDASVLGFSLTSQQRSIFVSFMDKNKGDLRELITALNG
jgi:phospholipid transport system substrate-binding protein